MPKATLRRQILAHRRSLSHDDWVRSSHLAQQNLIALPEFGSAACIALYAPAHGETDTRLILQTAFLAGKRVLFPAVCGDRMVLRQVVDPGDLTPGTFGIPEPCMNGVDHLADEADLIICPGVVFDARGHRIGYGKGFYDRFLRHPGRKAHLVGLCHDFQVTGGAIPADSHDIPMEIVVTDQRIIRCRK